jgi:tetratricopeptide (TPR) repeat protein
LAITSRRLRIFSKAIELNPQYAAPYHERGVAYVSLGNYQQAIKDFSKAIELEPQVAKVYYIRGLAYDILGNGQQSIKDIKIAARLGHKKAQDFLKSKDIVW